MQFQTMQALNCITYKTVIHAQPLSCGSTNSCPVCVCPNTTVEYTCTLTIPSSLIVWRLPNGTCPQTSDVCPLVQNNNCQTTTSTATSTCGGFTATYGSYPSCLTSTLTFVLGGVSNTIQCNSEYWYINGSYNIIESISVTFNAG